MLEVNLKMDPLETRDARDSRASPIYAFSSNARFGSEGPHPCQEMTSLRSIAISSTARFGRQGNPRRVERRPLSTSSLREWPFPEAVTTAAPEDPAKSGNVLKQPCEWAGFERASFASRECTRQKLTRQYRKTLISSRPLSLASSREKSLSKMSSRSSNKVCQRKCLVKP